MPPLVNLTLIVTFGVFWAIIDPAWASSLCHQFRKLPAAGPCSCPKEDKKVLCAGFVMYQSWSDATVLNIVCDGNNFQLNQSISLDGVDFSEISTLEVQACVVNVPLKDTLDKIGIRDVRSVLFDDETRLEHRLPLSGLNLTKVKINVKNITFVSDEALLPDSELLEEFQLCKSDISSLPNNLLSDKPYLRSLYITGNEHLNSLPEVLPIPSLEYLYLNRNSISRITSKIFSTLGNLTLLDLKQNPIEAIAEDAFHSNRALKCLHLQFFGAQLPERLFEPLAQLKELQISDGRLRHIQEELFTQQTNLRMLNLSGNQLTVLEGAIFIHLYALEFLTVDSNNLSAISRSIFPEPCRLRNISLKNNAFTKIPLIPGDISPFRELTALRKLELDWNQLTDIGTWANSPRLEELTLSHNAIKVLDINTIPQSLRSLDVSNNRIQHIDVDVEALIERQELTLSIENNSELTRDCRLINFVLLVQNGSVKLKTSDGLDNLDADHLYCDLEPSLCPEECNSCRLFGPQHELVLNCSFNHLERVPSISPDLHLLNFSSIVLDVRNNAIDVPPNIQNNPGYGLVNTLLLDNNLFKSWSVSNLHQNLSVLSLNSNKLFHLDRHLVDHIKELANLKQLHLLDNDWPCHCTLAKMMSEAEFQSKIVNFTALTCGSGRSRQQLTDFVKSCENEMFNFVLISFIVLSMIASGFAFYYRYQLAIKKWLFINHLCLSCVSEADADADFQYDAFISYSHRDEDFIAHELVPALECPPQKFRLCIHQRDFVPGMLIEPQILNAITTSRRTIVYVTQNFLRSEWTRHEFRLAFEQSLRENRARLIVILADDVQRLDELDPQLRVFFSTTTYLRKSDEQFWRKLVYAMPHRDVGEIRQTRKAKRAEQLLRNNSLREINRRREQTDLSDTVL